MRFDPDVVWAAQPLIKRGQQPADSEAAVKTCLTMKVLLGMALRKTNRNGREPASAGWPELGCARPEHHEPPAEDAGRRQLASGRVRNTTFLVRQHWDPGRG